MANELKAVLESPYELVVENHIVLFGGRDLTGHAIGKNDDGSMGEFFSKTTDVESDYTKTGRLYVDFEHGRDPDAIGNDKNTVLGYVDWKTAKVDDEGIIVRRVLNRRHKYMKWLEPLIKAGVIGNSSESIGDQAEKSANGEITKWPLRRDTLTVTPMEPRMIQDNLIEAVKALSEDFPQYKSLIPPDTALPGKDEQPKPISKLEKNTMTEKTVQEIVAEALAADRKEQAELAAAKAAREAEIKEAADAAYKKAIEDMKAAGPQNTFYHPTEKSKESDEGMGGFKHWMATGQVNGDLIRPNEEFMKSQGSYYVGSEGKAAWNATTGASGAFLVPDPLYNQIIAKRDIASWVRQVPCQYFQTSADHLLVPRESTKLTDFVLTAEAASYDENEATVSQKDLILYKYTKLTKVSEEFLMYQGTNWESWFANTLGRAVAGTENTIYTTATGTNEPEGIVTGSTVANETATTDIILPSELTALFGFLGAGYNVPGETAMLMANKTKWYLKGSGGTSVVPFAYVPTPQDGDFFGYKAVVNDDLEPYTTASAKCIIFGNFNFYGVVEKPGMIVQRNPYLYMANGQVGIFASIFRGGGVLQSEAFYYLTNKAS
jgi:HK97 family phage major capsid protein